MHISLLSCRKTMNVMSQLLSDFAQALTFPRDNINLPSPRDLFRVSLAYLHWYSPAGWQGMGTHNSTLFGNFPHYPLLTLTSPPLPHLNIISMVCHSHDILMVDFPTFLYSSAQAQLDDKGIFYCKPIKKGRQGNNTRKTFISWLVLPSQEEGSSLVATSLDKHLLCLMHRHIPD